MKVTSKLFVFALILSLILTVGAVAAAEDMSFDQSDEEAVLQETDMELDTSQDNDDEKLSASEADDDLNSPIGGENSVLSDIHTVTSGENFTDIQNVINSANDGDTIFLNGKTYKGSSQITVDKQITIVGGYESHPDIIATLDAQGLSRIMQITASNVVIKGIKFINADSKLLSGEASFGGAVRWGGANGTLMDSSFINNSASTGGAIYWYGANATIDNSNFENNKVNTTTSCDAGGIRFESDNAKLINSNFKDNFASRYGGAVRWYGVNGTVYNSKFINNTAYMGGAIYSNGFNFTINDSEFIKNNATYSGAVMFIGANSTVWDSRFINNTAHNGGASHFNADNCTVINSKFIGNSVDNSGGAIVWNNANGKLVDCEFIGNVANHDVGAILWNTNSHNGIMTNCEFRDNIATAGYAGAVSWGSSNGTLTGSKFINNTAHTSSGAVHWNGVDGKLSDSTFDSNVAKTGNHGALGVTSSSDRFTLENSNFINNEAYSIAGAFLIHASNANILNCNFTNNKALTSYGGAMVSSGYNHTVKNLIFKNNSANAEGAWTITSTANGGNHKISDCIFDGNSAIRNNGAMYVGSPNNVLTNLTFKNNHANVDNGALGAANPNLRLIDSKFINNSADGNRGALYVSSVNATVDNCIFKDNVANRGNGGAIGWWGANGTVTNSEFINNSNTGSGGAIYWNGVNGAVTNSEFRENNATGLGGAIRWQGDNGRVNDVDFIKNNASYSGAMIIYGVNCTVTDSNFINNTASLNGGAMHWNGANGTLINSEFIGNSAINHGGAIIWNAANGNLKDVEFSHNSATGSGAIGVNGANATFTTCEFYDNFANQSGGAVVLSGVNATIHDCDFIGNEANDGGAILINGANNTVDDCDFIKNKAEIGGAIHTTGSDAVIKNSQLSENDAKYSGNAIWVDAAFNSIIGNSIDNQKSDKPAIHVTNNHDIKLEGNEFTGNKNEVAYAEIIIDVADTFIGHLGQTVVIPVYVHDNYGNPLSGEVSLYGHNAEYLVDGRANLTMTMPTVEATQTLVVLYSSLHKVIQVVPADTKNPIDEIKQPSGDSDQLEIDFPADATGNVTVIINGKEYYAIVKDGKAVVDLKETPNGNYPATVIYSGDGNYSGMTKVIQVTVKNSEINPTYMISENKDIAVVYSGKATYKVLVTKNGKAVGAGESVTINFNGQNINVKTDAKGYVTLNLNTNIKVGTYNVKTTYKGVSVTNKVKINQIIKASNKKVKKSKKVTKIKVSLAKVDGKFLAKKTLKIKFNKKTYKVKTNKKGVGTWKVKKSMLKKLKVGKKVKYTVTYGKATLTKKLTIKK